MKHIYNVALIGCGQMGLAHLQEIYKMENVHFRYACDRDLSRAAELQKRYQVDRICDDYRECVNDEEVDIVIIATLPASHMEILKACVASKKHVLCEKPIGDTRQSAREFEELVTDNPDVKVLVGHILRHNATYQRIAEMIQGGAIGSPMTFRMVQNHHSIDWDRCLGILNDVSPLVDCGVHYVDILHWFTGAKVVKMNAMGIRSEDTVSPGQYNHGIVTMQLSDGSAGYYEAGFGKTLAPRDVKEFSGPKGRISLIRQRDRSSHQVEGDLIEYYRFPEGEYEMINVLSKWKSTDVQFAHLIKMIEEGVEATPTTPDMLYAFNTMMEADEMARKSLSD